jgi:hypothetical protein
MKSFKQHIRETSTEPQDNAPQKLRMTLRAFIDSLELFDDVKSEEDRMVDVQLDYPVYDTFTVKVLWQGDESECISERLRSRFRVRGKG